MSKLGRETVPIVESIDFGLLGGNRSSQLRLISASFLVDRVLQGDRRLSGRGGGGSGCSRSEFGVFLQISLLRTRSDHHGRKIHQLISVEQKKGEWGLDKTYGTTILINPVLFFSGQLPMSSAKAKN